MPHPLVKWSYEPPRAEDVPHAIARGTYLASLPPRGPVFVSIPFDDWDAEVDEAAVAHQTHRQVTGRQGPDPARVGDLVERLGKAKNPAMVAGPDIDMCGGWDAAVKFAEKLKLPVWATPAPGGGRLGFPENHALFRGILPPAVGPAGETLKEYDLVLVVGSSVFPYYPNIPGPLLGENTELVQITNDPDEAARAPMGEAILADPALALEVLGFKVEESDRDAPDPPWPAGDPEESDPISSSVAAAVLADLWPDDGILVLESPSSTLAMRSRLKLSKPGSYYFGAGGGLGFGLSAAVGVQLAQPDRQVVCVMGEGSVQYAVTAFWTAAAYKVPVKVLVLRNEEYAILKWFAEMESVTGSPGLDLPALESAEIAKGYGVEAKRVDGRDALHQALTDALATDGPQLVEVKVAPGMALA
jgi:benzoylformate decarboxylase